jgi:hypothetical protein
MGVVLVRMGGPDVPDRAVSRSIAILVFGDGAYAKHQHLDFNIK